MQEYQLPAEAIDSLTLQPLSAPTDIRQRDTEEAEKWLNKKKLKGEKVKR
jgi:hypothetical protein